MTIAGKPIVVTTTRKPGHLLSKERYVQCPKCESLKIIRSKRGITWASSKPLYYCQDCCHYFGEALPPLIDDIKGKE